MSVVQDSALGALAARNALLVAEGVQIIASGRTGRATFHVDLSPVAPLLVTPGNWERESHILYLEYNNMLSILWMVL